MAIRKTNLEKSVLTVLRSSFESCSGEFSSDFGYRYFSTCSDARFDYSLNYYKSYSDFNKIFVVFYVFNRRTSVSRSYHFYFYISDFRKAGFSDVLDFLFTISIYSIGKKVYHFTNSCGFTLSDFLKISDSNK